MNLTYRKASLNDLDVICNLIHRAVENMTACGIYQWDELYPTIDVFKTDIEKNQLYVGIDDNRIIVVFVINKESDPEYSDVVWTYSEENYRVLHRLCVDPDFQGFGIAKSTMNYIENLLESQGIASLRLDTFTKNHKALNLYLSMGYKEKGFVLWRKGKFVFLEKIL